MNSCATRKDLEVTHSNSRSARSGPRYSIIPGDFACDPRADVWHFRVLNLIGRHTNAHGWCRLKQIVIGDQIGATRETVNRKLKELVSWGYVEKRAGDATGRAIYYRTIMDRGEPPNFDEDGAGVEQSLTLNEAQAQNRADLPVRDGSHVGYNNTLELHSSCDRSDHTRCDRTHSQQNDPSLTTKGSTPSPHAGQSGVDNFLDETSEGRTASLKSELALKTMRADGSCPSNIIDRLLAPLVAQRRFSADDHLTAMREIGRRCAGLPDAHVAKVLAIIVNADVRTVKLQRVCAAIDDVRKAGLMLVVQNGSPEFAAWLRHVKKADPPIAKLMARSNLWQVPDKFPPNKEVDCSNSRGCHR